MLSSSGRWSVPKTLPVLLLILFVGLRLPLEATPAQGGTEEMRDETTGFFSPVPLADDKAIDVMISQVLGAWQVGDVEMLRQHHDADVVVVSGAWEPPLVGWDAYLGAYRAQRARTENPRLERRNTLIKVMGNSAWATYQWEFHGIVEGVRTSAVGHTTLVLEKREGKWLIVLNHTSTPPLPPVEEGTASSRN